MARGHGCFRLAYFNYHTPAGRLKTETRIYCHVLVDYHFIHTRYCIVQLFAALHPNTVGWILQSCDVHVYLSLFFVMSYVFG